MSGNIKLSPSSPLVNVPARSSPWGTLGSDRLGLVISLDWTAVLTLVLLVILGLGLRINQLGAIGFAEDEMNKLDAIHAYERGDFSVNAEHPMVMKVLMLLSLHAANNASEEAALRFPNALVGALTVIPLFLLTAAFFDRSRFRKVDEVMIDGVSAVEVFVNR